MKLRGRWIPIATTAVLGCAPALVPGRVDGRDPASVAHALLAAGRAGDWRTTLRWGDPEIVAGNARQLLARLQGRTDSSHIVLVWPYAAKDSTVFRELLLEQRDRLQRVLDSVYHVATVAEAAKLPPDTLLARCNAAAAPLDRAWLKQHPEPVFLGLVRRSDSLAYAFFEDPFDIAASISPPRPPPTGTVTLRRVGREWRGYMQQCLYIFALVACDGW
jgi:hypothetical protein